MTHLPIPHGQHRIKMFVDRGLVTVPRLRYYREVLTEQAVLTGWRVTDRFIHAREVLVGNRPAIVLEMRVRKARPLERKP